MTAEELVFLDVDDVIELHAAQLEVSGGGAGLRDRGLLESAVAQPQASFGGPWAWPRVGPRKQRSPSNSNASPN